jgi:hypothetical protein
MNNKRKMKKKKENIRAGQVSVVHPCNPSYSGDRDQGDHCLNPAWANSSRDPVLKIPNTKIGLAEWFKWLST